jgi:hypothetical protein
MNRDHAPEATGALGVLFGATIGHTDRYLF